MAVSRDLRACDPLPGLVSRKRSHSDMQNSTLVSKSSCKWINDEIYRTTILSLCPSRTESEADESLERDARDLGLSPVQKLPDATAIASSLSAITISSDTHAASVLSQSTAPTSCGSSERRPSTSLSNNSSRIASNFDMPTIGTEMERKRHNGFKHGLRKMTGFRKKKPSGSSTPSITSIKSHMTGTTINGSVRSPPRRAASIKSGNSSSSHDSPIVKVIFEPKTLADQEVLQRPVDSEQLLRIQAQQLDEKRRFLEYQTRLVGELLDKRDKIKADKGEVYLKRVTGQEEKNEKAIEALEARQLEDEMKQLKEHEAEKRAIFTRLKHMEAYCRTPSPPTSPSPLQPTFDQPPSMDSVTTLPERHVTQQHYENLAQAYHVRDNMDDLHGAKINVLRGKQKRALQNFMLKKEREVDQMEKEYRKELDSIDFEYAKQEAEIRQEFDAKRVKLEARWRLQALIEKTRLERATGLKYEGLPDVVAVEL